MKTGLLQLIRMKTGNTSLENFTGYLIVVSGNSKFCFRLALDSKGMFQHKGEFWYKGMAITQLFQLLRCFFPESF